MPEYCKVDLRSLSQALNPNPVVGTSDAVLSSFSRGCAVKVLVTPVHGHRIFWKPHGYLINSLVPKVAVLYYNFPCASPYTR